MLSKILNKETCAECRFCCCFRRTSLWETPIFTKENIDAIRNGNGKSDVLKEIETPSGLYATYDLSDKYLTDDPDEEAPCPYLDPNRGCILSTEEKPWDCKIWPLRVVRQTDGEVTVALTPTCPAINKLDIDKVRTFVNEELRASLLDYADEHPYLIKDIKEGWHIEM